MPPKKFLTTVTRIDQFSDSVKHFVFTLPPGEQIDFIAGQFAMSTIPNPENPAKPFKRAYSIASSPFEKDFIELAITWVQGGPGSTYFHQNLKVGSQFELMAPYGSFAYPKNSTGPLAFVATGTGITPMRSMYRQLLHDGYKDPLLLIHGVRFDNELYYEDELQALKKKYPNFNYVRTLSRPSDKWTGEAGYVQTKLEKYIPKDVTAIYVCGVGKMIEDVKTTMESLGHGKDKVHYEKW